MAKKIIKAVKKVVKKVVKKKEVKVVPVICHDCRGSGLQDQHTLCQLCNGNGIA